MKTIATINARGYLIGSTEVEDDQDGIDFGDLPTDGSYKWDKERNCFVPLGHGFGKIAKPEPYSTEFVLARIIETSPDVTAMPVEAKAWLEWYNANMRRRDEELQARRG